MRAAIGKTVHFATAAIVLCTVAVAAGAECPIPPSEIDSVDAATALAVKAAILYQLSPIPLKCVDYRALAPAETAGSSEKSANKDNRKGGRTYSVIFSERHSPECGGDPRTGPRLFSITVSSNGQMTTDAYGKDMAFGRFRPLKCPQSARPTRK